MKNIETMEEPELQIPQEQGIPVVDESLTELVEFIWKGKRQVVGMRASTWGRAKEQERGLRIREYEEELDDGTSRTVREYDAYAVAKQAEQIFKTSVISVNGQSWTRTHSVDALPDTWVAAFSKALAERMGATKAVGEARKKSPSR